MDLSRDERLSGPGLLYPLLVIAALAVIVFSIAGMAAISGWMPRAMVAAPPAVTAAPEAPQLERNVIADTAHGAQAFQCAECGVIDSVREIERAPVSNTAFETYSPVPVVAKAGRF